MLVIVLGVETLDWSLDGPVWWLREGDNGDDDGTLDESGTSSKRLGEIGDFSEGLKDNSEMICMLKNVTIYEKCKL